MSGRAKLLFYCQHSLGLGHLVRSYVLAGELAHTFDVTLIRGGEAPAGIPAPADVEIVQLPALSAGVDGGIRSSSGDVGDTIERRGDLLLERFAALRPAALVIELFPFGRKKLAPELLPLLEAARDVGCRVVCSVRDILVDRGRRQGEHDERASLVLNACFDAVLVHSDPAFARLEESFRPGTPLRVPVHHTGFVAPPHVPPRSPPTSGWRLVVSAGGGAFGEELLVAAICTRPLLARDVELRVIAGPFASGESWERLQRASQAVEGVELVRSVPDLDRELARASASLSQCGYNTAVALMRAGGPALVAPFSEGEENEQDRRAKRLAALGAVRVLEPGSLEPALLARSIAALREFWPQPLRLNFDGARVSTQIVTDLVQSRARQRVARRDWLDPLRAALAERSSPVAFFFRDDDAGWATSSLIPLLDLFGSRGVPLDLAVIPDALDVGLADELVRRADADGGNLRGHQHGRAHVNHEPVGRRCEFGPARSRAQQRADIDAGRTRLGELLGALTDPIFTPPWNRCTTTTAMCLAELGFSALSREAGARQIASGGLAELPVSIDWFGRTRVRRTRTEVALAAAAAVGGEPPVGVMLHHAALEEDGRRDTAALIELLQKEDAAVVEPMRSLLHARGHDGGPTSERGPRPYRRKAPPKAAPHG